MVTLEKIKIHLNHYIRKNVKAWKINGTANDIRSGYVSTKSPVFIGGCARSGTTLLRVVLDSHPDLCGGPESWLFVLERIDKHDLSRQFDVPMDVVDELLAVSKSRAEFIDRFFAVYCDIQNAPRWIDKTPKNITVLPRIFSAYPKAKFIHMVRDGRDVVCSLSEAQNVSIEPAIDRWVNDIEASREWWKDDRVLKVHYEDLVANTENVTREVLEFIGEPWNDKILDYYMKPRDVSKLSNNPRTQKPIDSTSVRKWEKLLTTQDLELIDRKAGYLLEEFGYLDLH